MSLRDKLTSPDADLTRSDIRVIRILLADYPGAGLGTAASLARLANVSNPTVKRLMPKLGFEGFADFQKALLAEVDTRMRSPLVMMDEKRPTGRDRKQSVAQSYFRSVGSCLDNALFKTPAHSYVVAAKLLLGARGRVLLLGGRFSRHLAGILAGLLEQIRTDVYDIGSLNVGSFDMLIDIGHTDALVVFDYRRYQTDVVRFTEQAVALHAPVVLFTDIWQSPLSKLARIVISAETEVTSPYDSLVPGLAQVEVLVKQILTIKGDAARDRIERLEAVRTANAVTMDEDAIAHSSGAKRAQPHAITSQHKVRG